MRKSIKKLGMRKNKVLSGSVILTIMLLITIVALSLIPVVSAYSSTVKMESYVQPSIYNNETQGYLLTLHLLAELKENTSINSDAFDNSLDNTDFSNIYELTVIRDHYVIGQGLISDNYKYFGKLQFPIAYDILDYGNYTFRLSRISDGGILSDITFNFTDPNPEPLLDPDVNPDINLENNSVEIIPDTTNTSSLEINQTSSSNLTILDKCSNVYATLDKSEYYVGDSVQILFSNIFGSSVNTELTITTNTARYRFVGDLNDAVFFPSEEGEYMIALTCDNIIIFHTNFTVIPVPPENLNHDTNNTIISNNSNNSSITWKKIFLKDSDGNSIITNAYFYKIKSYVATQNNSLISLSTSSDNGILAEDFTLNNSVQIVELVEIELSGISGLNDSSLVLNDLILNSTQDLNLYIEDVPAENLSFEGNIVASYAMDLSNLNFTDGTFTKVAVGKELWKCAEWDFSLQQCNGTWIKVMDINPGSEYNIIVSAADPGYIETGVATVNTLKSLYYPNDDVDIVMVVLDTKGYLVSDAYIRLTIIAPDNTTTITSTDDFITSNHKGIYEVGFTGTSLEGSYTLIVEAVGENVNSTMISQFNVSNYHPFEVLRNTPVTIDPNNGPFTSEITLISNIDASTFDYTEVMPSSFNITDLGGGTESIVGTQKYITWYNLTNNSIVYYSAQTPLDVPNVYEIGQGFLNYILNGNNSTEIFYESRPWFMAIDPVFIGNFFMFWDGSSSAPTNWTCVSCNSGEPFYGKFIMGNSTYGISGGSATHNHTINYVSNTQGAQYVGNGVNGADGANRASDVHTHAGISAATTNSSSNYPLYRQLKVIAYNNPGAPQVIPAGAIGIFNTTSLPGNWTQYSAQNGYFILGNGTANTTGGSNNHTHGYSITTSASAGTTVSKGGGTQTNVANAGHTHTGSDTTDLSNNIPPYIDIVLAKVNVTTTVPFGQGFIGMFNSSAGDGWINLSQSGQPFYQKILRAAATYNATGGGLNVSSHLTDIVAVTATANLATTRTGAGRNYATAAHTHNFNVSFTNASIIPPYVTVIFAYANSTPIYPPLIGASTCYKNGTGWVNCNTLGFNNLVTGIRTVCTSQNVGGNISNVSYILTNTAQNITILNVTTSTFSGGYWIYNASSVTLSYSGTWNLTVICSESSIATSQMIINWTIPWGTLAVSLVNPNTARNVTQNRTFNFTVNVSCLNGQCGDINTTLMLQANGTVPMYAGTPFYTTTANPHLPANSSCLSNMSAGNSCLINWTVNATGAINTSRLFYTNSSSLNFSSYVSRSISSTVNLTIIGNIAPITRSVTLTPVEPLFSDNLNCTFNITDQNIGDNLSATVTWYRNDVLITSNVVSVNDGEFASDILPYTYLTIGDVWRCGVVPYDGLVSGSELNSGNVTILASIPPKITNMGCLRNGAIWVSCTSIAYNQTISKVRATCTATDSYPVSVTFSLRNTEDSNTFFSGTTYDNSTGYWIFDNSDLLVLDSGNFNLSVNCTDANGTVGTNYSTWFIPWGNITATLISPNYSMNVTSKRFFNFTSMVACTGGECGYIKATLDPYKENFSSFEGSTEGWTHNAMNGTAGGAPAVGLDQWHVSNLTGKFGSYSWKYGVVANSTYATPPCAVLVTPNFSIRTNISNATEISFYHYLSSEINWDGGKIEYKLDNGNWTKVTDGTPAPNLFITGGYTSTYSRNADFAPNGWAAGERIWTGTVGSFNNFTLVRINISTLKGENLSFRFFFGGDDNTAGYGWYIDGFNITAWDYDPNKGTVSMNTSALPFYTTTQNPANSTNMSCLADMQSGDTCTTTWNVNASDVRGTYISFVTYASMNYSGAGQVVSKNSSKINLTIISNSAPVVSSITLNPQYAVVGIPLTCNFTITDASPLDVLIANVTWYRNDTIMFSSNVSVQHGVSYVSTLGGGNLTTGDTWHCGVRPYDQQVWGVQVNSTKKTVLVGIPPKLNDIQCLRNWTTWVNCSVLKFGENISGVRANCTNVNATLTNVTFNFSNTPDSKRFFNALTTTNSSDWWYYYYNMTIIDSGEFVMQANCNNNNSVTDGWNITWSLPWGSLRGSLVDPNSNTTVEYNQFFTFTANVSCVGGECGNVTALLDPGFPLGSPSSGTADAGAFVNIGVDDQSSGSYVNTQTVDTTYFIIGEAGWGDANSLIELGFNLTTLNIDANKNLTSINLSLLYCHSGDTIATITASGCNGGAPPEKTFVNPQNILLYNTQTGVWDSIGVLNTSNAENAIYTNVSLNGTLSKYVNSTGFIRVRIEMMTGGTSNSNQAFLVVNYANMTVTYKYIKGGAPVPTTIGALPFYTINSNPFTVVNYSCLSNMSSLNGGCQFTWSVNASGEINTTGEFWVIYNSSQYPSYITSNTSSHIWITIENTSAVPPITTLNTPANNLYTNNASIIFNCSATDNRNLSSIALYGNFDGTFGENESVVVTGKNASISLNRTLTEGYYTWNCLATDTDSNARFANTNRTLTIDQTEPYINLIYPGPGENISSRTVNFNISAIDNLDTSLFCNLTVDSVIQGSEFTLNNGSSIIRTVVNLTATDHYWNVTCRDHAYNYNTSETRVFTVLSTPPTISLQTIDNYYTNSSTVELYYFVDDGGYITQADLYINGVLNQTTYVVDTGDINVFTLTGVPQGIYNWTVNVTNNGGLTSQASPPRTFYVEFTAPTLNVTFPPDGYFNNQSSITFNFTATDLMDSVMTCKITINGVDVVTGIAANNNTPKLQTVNNLKNGLNYWNITCQNDAGNSNISTTRMMNVSAPPTITLNNPANDTFQKSENITLYYTPSSGTNISNCSLILNGVRNQTNTTISNGVQNNFRLYNLVQGYYNWSVNCTDNTSAVGSSVTRTFIIDKVAPNITLYYPAADGTAYGSTTIFNFTVYDSLDPSLTCSLLIDGSINRSGITAYNGYVTNVSIAISEGNHNWSVSCSDSALNSNSSETRNFTQVGAPTVSLVYPTPNLHLNYTNNVPLIYIPSSGNNLVNATLYINGIYNTTVNNPNNGVENNFTLNFTNGVYTWRIIIFDDVGMNGTSSTNTFYVDTVSPSIGIISPTNGQTVSVNNVTFRFNVTDNIPVATTCNVTVNDILEWSNISVSNGTTITRYKVLPDGNYNWSIFCSDNAGNTNQTYLINFTVYAPPNVTLNSPSINNRTRLQNITFNYTPRDDVGIDNCTLVINGMDNQSAYYTIVRNVPNYFNLTNMLEGDYNWTVRCNDTDSNTHTPTVRNLTIDLTPPTITMTYPDNGGIVNIDNIPFNWTATDYLITISCRLYVDDVYNRTVSQMSGTYFTPTVGPFTPGPHNWSLNCSDDINNSIWSPTWSFTVNNADLYIDTSRISFNNTNPNENQTINISVNVSNIGGVIATNALVNFYDGDPDLGGTFIGNMTRNVSANSSAIFSILWNITTGYHTIYVSADPYNVISELSELNNNATRNISLLQAFITSPPNASNFTNPNISITFNLTDYTGGTINYSVFVDNVYNGQNGSVTDSVLETINVTVAQGTHTIKIEALDNLGRRKNSTAISVTVDYTPPNSTITTTNNTWYNTTTPNISITSRDNLDLNINYTIYVNDTVNVQGNITNNSNIQINLSALSEGYYQLIMEAYDDFGNIANSTPKYIYVDLTAPTISLNNPSNGATYTTRTVVLNYTPYDNMANNVTCNITLDGNVVAPGTFNVSQSTTYTANNLAEGTHYWNVTCRDQAFNRNISETRSFNVYIPPIITLISPINNNWSNSATNDFFFNVSDETGLQNCSILLNGVISQTKTTAQLILNSTNNLTVAGMTSGNYTWAVECYDNTTYNSYNISTNRTFYVDLIPPEPTITTANNRWFNTGTPSISFNITDNMDNLIDYTFYANNTPNTVGTVSNNSPTSVNLLSLQNGAYTILLEGLDNAGNRKNSTSITIYIDTVVPWINLTSPPNNTNITVSTLDLNFTPYDNMATNLTCNLTLDGSIIASNMTVNNGQNQNVTISGLIGGYHYWNVTCVDSASNRNTSVTNSFYVVMPDLYVNTSLITFSNDNPIENETINITVNISNIGLASAQNFTVQIRVNSLTGTLIYNDSMSLGINESTNITANYSLSIGDTTFFVLVDTPLATNGTIRESNESNNNASRTIHVGLWQYVSGNTTDKLTMTDNSNQTIFDWLVSNASGSKLFVADIDSNINWKSLQALGINTSNLTSFIDFATLDTQLGSTNFTDSINRTYTTGSAPTELINYTIYARKINSVPIVNSTNNSNFKTGILWDYGDGGVRYTGTQDIVFVSPINKNTLGYNATVDYEMRLPATLRSYKAGQNLVVFYAEVN